MGEMFQYKLWLPILLLLATGTPYAMPLYFSPLESECRETGMAFTNDAHFLTLNMLADEDRYYTQGLHFFWADSPRKLSDAWTPIRNLGEHLNASLVSTHIRLGQDVFTPNDIQAAPPLVTDDRPFVGWSHLDVGQRIYFNQGSHAARLHLQANLGLVGPASFADVTQIEFHRIRRQTASRPELDPDPSAGWSKQLGSKGFPGHAQFVVNYGWSIFSETYTHKMGGPSKIGTDPKIGMDIGAESEADFGSLYGNMGVALQLRAGRMTRSVYFPMPNGNGKSWEAFGFVRSEIKTVGWNQVLTGGNSHQVSISNGLWQNELGLALRGALPFPELSLTGSLWSRETNSNPIQPFQPGHTDYRPELQARSRWMDHGFGTVRLAWYW